MLGSSAGTGRAARRRDRDVDEFTDSVLESVRTARDALKQAVAEHDSYAISRALDELENALAIARESGIEVPPAETGETG